MVESRFADDEDPPAAKVLQGRENVPGRSAADCEQREEVQSEADVLL